MKGSRASQVNLRNSEDDLDFVTDGLRAAPFVNVWGRGHIWPENEAKAQMT